MKLQIDTDTKIVDVQKKFTEVYPFLKIGFYKKQNVEKKLSAVKDRSSSDNTINEQDNFLKPGSVDINRYRTIAALAKEFYEKFEIAMQVSRKAGNIWIETSKTDDRTLKTQNQLGKPINSRQIGILSEEEVFDNYRMYINR